MRAPSRRRAASTSPRRERRPPPRRREPRRERRVRNGAAFGIVAAGVLPGVVRLVVHRRERRLGRLRQRRAPVPAAGWSPPGVPSSSSGSHAPEPAARSRSTPPARAAARCTAARWSEKSARNARVQFSFATACAGAGANRLERVAVTEGPFAPARALERSGVTTILVAATITSGTSAASRADPSEVLEGRRRAARRGHRRRGGPPGRRGGGPSPSAQPRRSRRRRSRRRRRRRASFGGTR